MNFVTLKASISDWFARSDITDANAVQFIEIAMARINRSLRIRAMETVYAELLSADGTSPCPMGLLEFKHLFLYVADSAGLDADSEYLTVDASTVQVQNLARSTKVCELQYRPSTDMFRQYDANRTGIPKYATRYGDRLYLWPVSTDMVYSAGGIYFAEFPALAEDNPTNWLTESAPDLLLSACMTECAAYVKSPEWIQYWQGRFDRALNELQAADDRQEFSATPLQMRVCGP